MPEYPWLIYRMSEGPLTVKEVHQGVNEQLNRKLGTDWGYSEYEWAELLQGFRPLPIRTASGTIAHFSDGADSVPMKSVVANIVPIQSGTGTPSPSNPRPISGTGELTLTKTGTNLFDKKPFSDWVTKSPYMVLDDNLPKNSLLTMVFIDKDTSVDISGCCLGFVKDTYNGGTVQNSDFHWALQNGTVRGRTDNVAEIGTDLLNYLMMYPTNEATYNKIFSRFDIMIVAGAETATTYEPYNAETYTIDLGQEIMGGTADVVGGVGESTHKLINLADLTWTLQNGAFYSQPLVDANSVTDAQIFNGVSSHFVSVSYNYLYAKVTDNSIAQSSSKRIYIYSSAITTLEQLETAIADAQLAYELATPTEYTFTGQPINSYQGVNNLYVDSGEVLEVEYRANF